MAKYPDRLTNLLVKAGLIGEGVKVIMAYHNNKKRLTLDEMSNTWVEDPDEYEVDFREASEYIIPVVHNGEILGDWRLGLTGEEVRIIHEEAHVPIFERNQTFRINHGMRFYLEDPRDMAFYRIAVHSGAIAENRNKLTSLQRFYWFDELAEKVIRRKERSIRKELIQKLGNKSRDELELMYHYMNLKFRKGWNLNPSLDQIDEKLTDVSLSRDYEKLHEAMTNPILDVEVTVLQAIEYDLLLHDSATGQVTSKSGEKLGMNSREAAESLLKKDKGQLAELRRKLDKVLHPIGKAITDKPREAIKQYDTVIYDAESVKFWPQEACRQYLVQHGVKHMLQATDSPDKWRRAVLTHYEQSMIPDTQKVNESSEPVITAMKDDVKVIGKGKKTKK